MNAIRVAEAASNRRQHLLRLSIAGIALWAGITVSLLAIVGCGRGGQEKKEEEGKGRVVVAAKQPPEGSSLESLHMDEQWVREGKMAAKEALVDRFRNNVAM